MKRISFGNICNISFKSISCEYYSTDSNFKPLILPGLGKSETFVKRRQRLERPRPKYYDLTGKEDWSNLWPSARTFSSNMTLLPLRQGYVKNNAENQGVKPEKYANAELMKIPNFLHITPVHIKKHCDALKKYCTKWPEELNDNTIRRNFPLEFTRTDYIHSAPSIRDARARIVTLKFQLQDLQLNDRERYKFLKLIGPNRYDKQSNVVTIIADRCPSHRQNYDYLIYVFTALITESKKFEKWELEAGEGDWVHYNWEQSKYKDNVESYLEKAKIDRETMANYKEIEKKLKLSIESIYNDNENAEVWENYKKGVVDLLQLKKHDHESISN